MPLEPAGSNKIAPPAIKATADGALAGVGDVKQDDFLAALERSTPKEFRDQAPDDSDPKPREIGDEPPAAQPKKAKDEKPAEAVADVEKPAATAKKEPTPEEAAATAAADGTDVAAKKPDESAATAKPKTFDPGERLTLGVANDGSEVAFTRAQLANMTRQYPEILQKANESLEFAKLFNGDLNTVKTQWAPMLETFKAKPEFEKFVADQIKAYGELGMDDPEYASYMQEAADYYRQQKYGTAPPNREIDRETERRVAAIEKQNREAADAARNNELRQYIQNETLALKAADPRLDDPDIWRMVHAATVAGLQQDQTYTLTRSATDNEAWIARMWAQSPLNTANREPAPTPVPVPTLVGGSGAAPRATRDTGEVDLAPQKFANLDDATADWKKNRAAIGAKLGFGN